MMNERISMEHNTHEPEWLKAWRKNMEERADTLPEIETYEGGVQPVFLGMPNFEGTPPTYRVVSIDKELELYTLKEATETLGITDLLQGLLTSGLLPVPLSKSEALARAKIGSGLLCYVQPSIDEEGNFMTQRMHIETTLGLKGAADIFIVIAKTGARVHIDHDLVGGGDEGEFSRTCIIVCEEGAEVAFGDTVDNAKGAASIRRFGLVGSNARIDWREQVSAKMRYSSHLLDLLVGTHGAVEVQHILLAGADAAYDIRAISELRGENTKSVIGATGAAASSGHIIYQGHTKSIAHAVESVGSERAKFLLIDDSARIEAVPSLEVQSGAATIEHELAITHIHDEELFYATTKGIGEQEARVLAVEGIFAEVKPTQPFVKKLLEVAQTHNH